MLQLLREWPPGYGGVERVAHELANAWAAHSKPSNVYTLVAQRRFSDQHDPLPVEYRRIELPRLRLGELLIPLPSRTLVRLLRSGEPLHAHLPCPTVLLLAALAKALQPRRMVTVHWHAFLSVTPTLKGRLISLYQGLALQLLHRFDRVITTSPVLQDALINSGLSPNRTSLLPCCLSPRQEELALNLERPAVNSSTVSGRAAAPPALRLISISRLGSYKRVDWLLDALYCTTRTLQTRGQAIALHLDVVGDGPQRQRLEHQAQELLPGLVSFHGRVDEAFKLALLERADLLVLLASSCNEAFGIVQLEAMACGVPAVALQLPQSGMHWVSRNQALPWSGELAALPELIANLACDRVLRIRARQAARERYLELFRRQHWLKQLEAALQQ